MIATSLHNRFSYFTESLRANRDVQRRISAEEMTCILVIQGLKFEPVSHEGTRC
uniref:Uncharacterized protein n=1 Tax=Arundo donax TaxID=35708 RepID=A0A0A9GWJ1_ARUDO